MSISCKYATQWIFQTKPEHTYVTRIQNKKLYSGSTLGSPLLLFQETLPLKQTATNPT